MIILLVITILYIGFKFKHKKRMGEHPFESFFNKNDR
jgi:hypothetical protein